MDGMTTKERNVFPKNLTYFRFPKVFSGPCTASPTPLPSFMPIYPTPETLSPNQWTTPPDGGGGGCPAEGNADPGTLQLSSSCWRECRRNRPPKRSVSRPTLPTKWSLKELQDQYTTLSRGLKKLEDDQYKRMAAPTTSLAPGLPLDYDPHAITRLRRELQEVRSYYEGQIRTLGVELDTHIAQTGQWYAEVDRTLKANLASKAPPCASTGLSKHGTRLAVVFLVFFLTAVVVVRLAPWGR